jgi:hypothetical protein
VRSPHVAPESLVRIVGKQYVASLCSIDRADLQLTINELGIEKVIQNFQYELLVFRSSLATGDIEDSLSFKDSASRQMSSST